MPPAVKGTVAHNPYGQSTRTQTQSGSAAFNADPMSNLPSLAGQVSKRPQDYAESRAMNGPRKTSQSQTVIPTRQIAHGAQAHAQASPATRDPHPYTGFTAPSSKTEFLMQTVSDNHNADNMSSSGRTVLYDPGPSQTTTRKGSLVSTASGAAGGRRPSVLDLTHGHEMQAGYEEPLDTSTTIRGVYRNGNYMLSSNYGNQSTYATAAHNKALTQGKAGEAEYAAAVDLNSGLTDNEEDAEVELTAEERAKRDWEWFTAPNPAAVKVKGWIESAYPDLAAAATGTSIHASSNAHLSTPSSVLPIGSGRRGQTGASVSSTASPSKILSEREKVKSEREKAISEKEKAKEKMKGEQAAAVALLAPALSNMAIHRDNDHRNPFTQYENPPAWCVDNTETSPSTLTAGWRGGSGGGTAGSSFISQRVLGSGSAAVRMPSVSPGRGRMVEGGGYGVESGAGGYGGGTIAHPHGGGTPHTGATGARPSPGGTPGGYKSLLGENQWNPPRRVGRDPRYPVSWLDGRVTRFEDVTGVGGIVG